MRPQTFLQFRFWAASITLVTMSTMAISGTAIAQMVTPSPEPSPEPPPASDLPVLILGQPCTNPYVVAVPSSNLIVLNQIQEVIPSAFLTDSRLGTYIQAGSAPRRSLAARVSRQLRRAGFDARVIYRPVSCEPSP